MKRAFTLIELLTVISIIALLSTIVLANMMNARTKGQLAAGEEFDASLKHSIGDQLVGEWTFDDASTTGAYDYSGHGNNGIIVGSVSSTTGYNGKRAMSFDGVSTEYIDVGNSPSFSSNIITVSAWIKVNGNVSVGSIVSNARDCCGSYNGFQLMYGSSYGGLNVGIWNGSAASVMFNPAYTFGTWHQVAFSYDGTNLLLYSDGVLVNKTTTTLGIGSPASYNTHIGAMGAFGNNGLNGAIDDVRIYNNTLTLSEIGRMYAEGKVTHQNLALK